MTTKKSILILGVASVQRDALVELKKMGYVTHACAMAPDGPGVEVADYFVEINILHKKEIIEYIKEHNIDIVYSVGSDMAMPIACSISEELNMPHFVSEKTARICNNKDLMRRTLGVGFEGNLNFQIIENSDEELELDFPFIMKPTDSQGQRGVLLIHSEEEFLKNYEDTKSYSRSGLVILEQYITGPELSVNGYIVDGKIKFLEESDRETWPDYTGLIHRHVIPSKELPSSQREKLHEIIEKTCNKLEILNGPFYVQMKLEGTMPYIIEITPRLDGCHMWNLLNNYCETNLLTTTFNHLLENNTESLSNYSPKDGTYYLEFICQVPKTKADYSNFKNELNDSIDSFLYYEQDQTIRPVNGKFDKIGYFINKR